MMEYLDMDLLQWQNVCRERYRAAVRLPKLTARQLSILHYIRNYIEDCGCAPKLREIALQMGATNVSTAFHQIETLERKGVARREKYRIRGLAITAMGHACLDMAFGVR